MRASISIGAAALLTLANLAAAAPPVVTAGDDQTIEMPSVAIVSGTATHDGPASAVAYSWTADGPAGVTFAPPNAKTEVRFPAAGTYTLTLTVRDGTESGSDAVTMTVMPAVYPAADDDSQLDRGWLRVAAADVGMNQALLDQAAVYASSAPSGTGAGMIVRNGRLVHSWGDIDMRYDVKSTTKSIGGLTLGIAMDDARVSLTDRADTHLATIAVPPDSNTQTGWIPLMLRRGLWVEQRVVSEAFVDTVQTPRPEIATAANPNAAEFPSATSDYGVLWWTNENGLLPNVPHDAFWAWGLGDSMVVVIPSLDLVIARAGPQAITTSPEARVWNDDDWNGDYSVLAPFLDPIVQSVAQ